jgi:hypothetical protein
MTGALSAGVAVLVASLMAVVGPLVGLSPWITSLLVLLGLGSLTVDAARFGGRGGHLVAEALPGGLGRLRRIAIHEAAHALVAREEGMAVGPVHVGSLACLRAGLAAGGAAVLQGPHGHAAQDACGVCRGRDAALRRSRLGLFAGAGCQHDAACGVGVAAGQAGQLLVKALEAQVLLWGQAAGGEGGGCCMARDAGMRSQVFWRPRTRSSAHQQQSRTPSHP